MNKKTTSEITITGKLQQLPLPDMEDAIWARIKTQLDLDMPTDDDGGDTPDKPWGAGWLWGTGTALFVAALVTTFFLTKKPSTALQSSPLNKFETITPTIETDPQKSAARSSLIRNKTSPRAVATGNTSGIQDSIMAPLTNTISAQPIVTPPPADSTWQTTFVALPPLVVDSILLKKKKRGITGITDNDYRITPANDSM